MPNVNASANVSVWNKYEDRNVGYSKLNHPGSDGMYKCHHRHNCDTDTYNGQKNLLLFSTGRAGAGDFHCGKQGTRDKWRSYCITPNSGKSRLVEDQRRYAHPCPGAASASWTVGQVGRHIEGEKKQVCTYNNLSAKMLSDMSKNENATKHTKDGKNGRTIYEQLLRQYCSNSSNILDKVVDIDKYNRCIDISNNPSNVSGQNPNIIFSSKLKGFVSSDMKADFCKENPQNQYCACYNTLNLNCRSREHMDKPGCKEYHTFLKGDQSKEDPDIKEFVATSGTTLTHCLAIKDGTPVCAKSGVFVEPSKVEYLKSCPPNVMCNIHQNFSGAEIQANNFNNNQECNVKSESQVIVSPDGSSSSQSFVSTIAPNTGVNSDDGIYSIPTEPNTNTNTSEKTKTENNFNNLLIAVFFLFIMGGSSMMAVALIASMK